jgi:poly(3-hydroxybutyrate) depolymerase
LETATAFPLPIDPTGISISGISSGGDMAAQFQVAFSSVVAGSGIFAGQSYHCAVQYFPGEPLSNKSNPSVPYCDGCPENTTVSIQGNIKLLSYP